MHDAQLVNKIRETKVADKGLNSFIRRHAPAAVVVLSGALATLMVFLVVSNLEHRKTQADFERLASERHRAIVRTTHEHIEALYALRSFCEVTDTFNRDQFNRFAQSLLKNHNSIQALEWIPHVTKDERTEYESAAVADGIDGFRFTQRGEGDEVTRAADRDEYFPVYYVYPMTGNERAVGFDLASNRDRRIALEEARLSERLTATARITLVQETGDQYGVLMFVPVFRDTTPTTTEAASTREFAGFALGVFRLTDVVLAAIDDFEPGELSISLRDQIDTTTAHTLAEVSTQNDDDPPRSALGSTLEFDVGGRQWTVSSKPTRLFFAEHASRIPLIVAIGGGILTLLAVGFTSQLTGNARQIERVVVERTAELAARSVALQRQVSERTKAECTLRQLNNKLSSSNSQLADRNKEIIQLTYAITHDLQTPLVSITGRADSLQARLDRGDRDSLADGLDRIQRSAERMTGMLDGMMDWANCGERGSRSCEIHVAAMITQIADELAHAAQAAGVIIRIADSPAVIHSKPDLLRRALTNLLSNAVKYSAPSGPGRIEVSVDSNDNGIQISIQDNGCGVEPSQLDRVFLPFTRVGRDRSGTGLGLSISRRLIESVSGRVWLESDGVSGTTAIVRLPRSLESHLHVHSGQYTPQGIQDGKA